MGESGIRGKVGAIHFRFSLYNGRLGLGGRYVKSFTHQQTFTKQGPTPVTGLGWDVMKKWMRNVLRVLGIPFREGNR